MQQPMALKQPLAWSAVLQRQLVLLLRSTRVVQLTLFALALLLGSEMMSRVMAQENVVMPSLVLFFNWLWLLGMAWGVMVWSDEGPAKRKYHASLPVDRTLHDVTRVVAGALWLMATVVLMVGVGALLALTRGAGSGLGGFSTTAWLNYFTAPLQMYLLLAIFSVSLNKPFQWFLGGIVAVFASLVIASQFGIDAWMVAWRFLFEGSYGFATAMADGFAGEQLLRQQLGTAHSLTVSSGQWMVAAGLWIAVLAALVWGVAARRRIG
jgi:hypothetical protein